MANVRIPGNVIRIRKPPPGQAIGWHSWGYKWHLVATKKKRVTACGIILRPSQQAWCWEAARLADVKPKRLCLACFRGLKINGD